MNAFQRLEKGGIRFERTAEGTIAYHNTWPGDVPADWATPLLAELRVQRDEVAAILEARQRWGELWEEWGRQPDDPLQDSAYAWHLCALAIAAGFPCYDGGPVDLGEAGWRRVTTRMVEGFTTGEAYRPADDDLSLSTNLTQKENDDMGIKIEQTTFDAVPTGEYKAVITAIEPAEGKFGPQLQIKSEINDGPYAGNTFLCWVSPKFSPKSRLYEWVEAALAMPVPKSYTFDSDHLIGREVIATLVVRELDGGGEVNRVDKVRKVTN